MTCKLNEKFEKAVGAVKDALHAAIDAESFDKNALVELTSHYHGLQTIARDNAKHKHDEVPAISFDMANPWSLYGGDADGGGIGPDGCYNLDYSMGEDVITFTNVDEGTVNVQPREKVRILLKNDLP